ncbi:MAG: RES domain-containing protein [Prevotella sp.]|nr:RES domain-containing protein [Prevotella sp.]
MGKYKELEIEQMNNPFCNIPNTTMVGQSSFRNKLIVDYFKKYGVNGKCTYTDKNDIVVPFKELLMEMCHIINEHYEDADNAGIGWAPVLEDEGPVPGFHTEANGYVVPDNRRYYDDMNEFLLENDFDCRNDDIFEAIVKGLPYKSLIEKDPYGTTESEERIIDWHEIVRKSPEWIKDKNTISVADKVRHYELVEAMQYLSDIVITTEKLTVYRTVRYAEEQHEPVEFGMLTSPPIEYTCDLRMSRMGESMFYGASSQELSLAECVGCDKPWAYTGEFEFSHPMLLLDLRKISQRITIFDTEVTKYQTLRFLKYFNREISKPVNSGHEEEYIPTQFVTSLFRESLNIYHKDGTKQPIEGILYTSSKNTNEWDVVLFYDNASSAHHLELKNYTKKRM